jgi:hypothetical protein
MEYSGAGDEQSLAILYEGLDIRSYRNTKLLRDKFGPLGIRIIDPHTIPIIMLAEMSGMETTDMARTDQASF